MKRPVMRWSDAARFAVGSLDDISGADGVDDPPWDHV